MLISAQPLELYVENNKQAINHNWQLEIDNVIYHIWSLLSKFDK